MAAFHDTASADSKLPVAILALTQSGPNFLRRIGGNRIDAGAVGVTAMRARYAVRPADFLEISAGLVFVSENRVGEIDGHRGRPCLCPHTSPSGSLCQV